MTEPLTWLFERIMLALLPVTLNPFCAFKLRYGMNVTTNSIDPAMAAPAPDLSPFIPIMNTCGAFVDGWSDDGSSVHVIGWTVTGGHDARGG